MLKRTGFKSKTSLRPRLWVGKKTIRNMKANAKLSRKFKAMEITRCELGYVGCTRDDFLSWAHGRKRTRLQEGELENLVILACINCHAVIERMSPEGMLAIVESVISERGWTVAGEALGNPDKTSGQ